MTEETFDPSRIEHEDAARLDYLKLLQIIENNVYDTQHYTHGKLLCPAKMIHKIAESIIANIKGDYGEYVISRLQKNGFTLEKGRGSIQDRAEQAIRKLERQAYISMARYGLEKIIEVDVGEKIGVAEKSADLIRAADLSEKGRELDRTGKLKNPQKVKFQMNALRVAMNKGDDLTIASAETTITEITRILMSALGIHERGMGGRAA